MRFLVTGGTGFVGTAVARAAARAGHDVRVLARDPGRAHDLAGTKVELRRGSQLERAAIDSALQGVDVLVQAAATYSYGREDAHRMITENPELTRAAIEAAHRAGTPHVIDVASAVVFKPHPAGAARPGVTDLGSPLWGPDDEHWDDPYLRSKVLAHELVLEARADGTPVSTVFPTMVIGPRDRVPGTSGVLIRSLLQERNTVDASLGWCDVRDVADVIVAMAERGPGQEALVSVGTVTLRPMARLLDKVTGKRRWRVFLPAPVLRAFARMNERAGGRLRPGLPPPASLEYMLTRGPIDGSSGEALLGRPYRPLEETLTDTLAWWAEHGVITRDEAGRAG